MDLAPSTSESNNASTIWQPSNPLLARHPWLTFVLPLAVYMIVGSFEPSPPKPATSDQAKLQAAADADKWLTYPVVYTIKIALTVATMVFVLPGYRQFPFRVSPLALVVGVVGVVLWIAISGLGLEQHFVELIGKKNPLVSLLGLSERPSYNPLAEADQCPMCAYAFLGIRFLGLALIVPIIEEFFLRGFLMRYVMSYTWWEVPFGEVTRAAVIVGTLFPVMYHPEKLAAAVWFTLVTWLMIRTRNIWDCVAAHAVTNLLLGVYVVTQGQWQLW